MDNTLSVSAQREQNDRAIRTMTPFSFLLPVAIFIAVCLVSGIYPFGNATLLCEGNSGYIASLEQYRRALSGDGGLLYSFSDSLGSGVWSLLSSILSSPFSLVALLFPYSKMSDAFLLITLLRLGAAGSAAYAMTAALNRRAELCLAFSAAYSGCACMLLAIFMPQAADAAVFLPAVGAGILSLLKNGRVSSLVAALTLYMLTGWRLWPVALLFTAGFFVWGSVVVRSQDGEQEKSHKWSAAGRCTAAFVLAAGISAVFMIPSLIENAEASSAVRSLSELPSVSFSELISGLFMGGSVNPGANALLFCSGCTLVMLPIYIFNTALARAERLMGGITLLLLLAAQLFNSFCMLFTAFTLPAYYECGISFVFCTLAVALAARGLANPTGITVGKAIASWATVIVLFVLSMLLGKSDFLLAVLTAGFLTLYAAIALIVMSSRRPSALFGVVIMLCITAEAVTAGAFAFSDIKEQTLLTTNESFVSTVETELALDRLLDGRELANSRQDSISRVRGDAGIISSELLLAQFSADSESRISQPDTEDFYASLGIVGEHGWTRLTESVFAVRYILRTEESAWYTPLSMGETAKIYENPTALSIGFAASQIIQGIDTSVCSTPFVAQELLVSAILGESVSVFTPARMTDCFADGAELTVQGDDLLLFRFEDSAVLSYSMAAQCSGTMYMYLDSTLPVDAVITVNDQPLESSRLDALVELGYFGQGERLTVSIALADVSSVVYSASFMTLDADALDPILEQIALGQATYVSYSGSTVRAVVSTASSQQLVTTIPYSSGWSAVVDGRSAQTVRCAGSLLGVVTGEGQHTVTLTYTQPGLVPCGIISALCLLAALIFIIVIERPELPVRPVRRPVQPEPRPPVEQTPEPMPLESYVIPVHAPEIDVDLDFEADNSQDNWL